MTEQECGKALAVDRTSARCRTRLHADVEGLAGGSEVADLAAQTFGERALPIGGRQVAHLFWVGLAKGMHCRGEGRVGAPQVELGQR